MQQIGAVPESLEQWSRIVRENAGQRCERCGETRALVAHHVIPKSLHPELMLDLRNGECLCSNCHWEHHRTHPVGRKGPRRGPVRSRAASERRDRLQGLLDEATTEIDRLRVALAAEGEHVRRAQRSAMDSLRATNQKLREENTRLRSELRSNSIQGKP